MSSQTHGYSGKPLYQKLGMKPGMTCLVIRAPKHYSALVAGAEDIRLIKRSAPAGLVHAFCGKKRDVAPLFERALKAVESGGMIWMS